MREMYYVGDLHGLCFPLYIYIFGFKTAHYVFSFGFWFWDDDPHGLSRGHVYISQVYIPGIDKFYLGSLVSHQAIIIPL